MMDLNIEQGIANEIITSIDSSNFFFAPLPIASPKFIMNLIAKISLQSGDCRDKICLK